VRGVDDLYQEVLLDHATRPRNRRRLDQATATGEGQNPFCDDCCTVYLAVTEGVINDLAFEGSGCAIMLASASLLTLTLAGKTPVQARAIFDQFRALLTTEADPDTEGLGDLAALAGVKEYPSRIKCATLPWHALRAALDAVAGWSSLPASQR
jgi:nitrogen fixation NifU-like protein